MPRERIYIVPQWRIDFQNEEWKAILERATAEGYILIDRIELIEEPKRKLALDICFKKPQNEKEPLYRVHRLPLTY